jgi:hypothetical protein
LALLLGWCSSGLSSGCCSDPSTNPPALGMGSGADAAAAELPPGAPARRSSSMTPLDIN